jgi:hypothetical protein
MNSKSIYIRAKLKSMCAMTFLILILTVSVLSQEKIGSTSAQNSSKENLFLVDQQPLPSDAIFSKDLQPQSNSLESGPIVDLACVVACRAVGGSWSTCIEFCTGYPTPH